MNQPLPNLHIRPARPDDAAPLTAYVTAIINEPHNNVTLDPGQWTMTVDEERTFLEKTAATPDKGLFLVADLAGQIVGCANISRNPRPTMRHAATLGISVAATHRRQGIGRALMLALVAWAKQNQIVRVELKVFTRNTPAIALYESLDFVKEGRHPKAVLKQGIWCDDLTMALLLDAPAPSEIPR